jgi:hypothetical protein
MLANTGLLTVGVRLDEDGRNLVDLVVNCEPFTIPTFPAIWTRSRNEDDPQCKRKQIADLADEIRILPPLLIFRKQIEILWKQTGG